MAATTHFKSSRFFVSPCILLSTFAFKGHEMAQLVETLRYNRKVADSFPSGVAGIFH
jgi:hypothetical protein